MNTKITQAIKAIDSTRLTFQQVIANQSAARAKKATISVAKPTSDCISPPSPNDDGSWKDVSPPPRRPKASTLTEPTIFPREFPPKNTEKIELDASITPVTTGVTVHVRLFENTQLHYSQFLQAMLECFQQSDPSATILQAERTTLQELHPTTQLKSHHDIQKNKDALESYLNNPIRQIGRAHV